jgi:nucleoside-diphosphate-sugar epimerase
MKKIVVAGGSGLTGQSISDIAHLFPNFDFYIHNRSLGDLTNTSVVEKILKEESPDLILLNAASLSGSQGLASKKKFNSINNSAIYRNFVDLKSDYQKLFCFSSYHVFDTEAPFLRLDIDSLNKKNEYALEKSNEILTSWNDSNVLFILFPHLFGRYDNFSKNRAHFIASSISRIKLAKENKDPEIQFFGNRNRVLQFASGVQAANFALELCSQIDLNCERLIHANIGWVANIGLVFTEICQLLEFSGVIKYDEAKSELVDKDMYFHGNEVLMELPNEFTNELKAAINYFECKAGDYHD